MNQEELKLRIGTNITQARKALGMTQAELASRLNYSDKAVSKWERGESVPDVLTLTQIAGEFGLTVNDLIYGQDVCPVQPAAPQPEPQPRRPLHTKPIIQKLVTILVWFIALFVYVMVDSFGAPFGWLAFFAAVPINAIVLLCLRSAWGRFDWNLPLISVIIWGISVLFYVVILVSTGISVWRVFLLGALAQVAVLLWFKMLFNNKEE